MANREKTSTSYTTLINLPQYIPSGKNVDLSECVDVDQYVKLVNEINSSEKAGKISKTEAKFLRLCATRWIKFDYSKVGDFYASSLCTEQMQNLLERSAMVLLDMDDMLKMNAIACRSYIEDLREQAYREHIKEHPEDTEEYKALDIFTKEYGDLVDSSHTAEFANGDNALAMNSLDFDEDE